MNKSKRVKTNKCHWNIKSKRLSIFNLKRSERLSPSLIERHLEAIESTGGDILFTPLIKGIAHKAAFFDFGVLDVTTLSKETDRASELFNENFLKLPFQYCIFRFFRKLQNGKKEENLCYLRQDEEGILLLGFCKYETVFNKFNVTSDLMLFIERSKGKGKEITTSYLGVTNQEEYDAMVKPLEGDYLSHCIEDVLGTLLILNTKNVPAKSETEHLLFDGVDRELDKVNQKIVIDGKFYTETMKVKGKKGTKSPHPRRGHIRQLSTGKKTWVRDCLINIDANTVDIHQVINAQYYEVKKKSPKNVTTYMANRKLKQFSITQGLKNISNAIKKIFTS
jgi:hypothetical protein